MTNRRRKLGATRRQSLLRVWFSLPEATCRDGTGRTMSAREWIDARPHARSNEGGTVKALRRANDGSKILKGREGMAPRDGGVRFPGTYVFAPNVRRGGQQGVWGCRRPLWTLSAGPGQLSAKMSMATENRTFVATENCILLARACVWYWGLPDSRHGGPRSCSRCRGGLTCSAPSLPELSHGVADVPTPKAFPVLGVR